jgi:hypothetical protein
MQRCHAVLISTCHLCAVIDEDTSTLKPDAKASTRQQPGETTCCEPVSLKPALLSYELGRPQNAAAKCGVIRGGSMGGDGTSACVQKGRHKALSGQYPDSEPNCRMRLPPMKSCLILSVESATHPRNGHVQTSAPQRIWQEDILSNWPW